MAITPWAFDLCRRRVRVLASTLIAILLCLIGLSHCEDSSLGATATASGLVHSPLVPPAPGEQSFTPTTQSIGVPSAGPLTRGSIHGSTRRNTTLPLLLLLELPGCAESERLLVQLLKPVILMSARSMGDDAAPGVRVCHHATRSWRADCLTENGTLQRTARLVVGRHLGPLLR